MENKSVYEQLFDIANENMQQSGHSFVHPKAAFLYYEKNDPHAVDVYELMKTEATNEEFVEIAYLAILNRPIDSGAAEHWKKKASSMSSEKFRSLVILRLTASDEANKCHKRIYNNIYCYQKRKYRKNASGGIVVQKLLPLYRKLPAGLKSFIKKIMGVNEG